jgi:hypothetical protein
MANTYYKYAEREADSYINWADITKNMSEMLLNENKAREEKKAAIDKSSRDFGMTLSETPQGENTQMNEWALKYASDAQAARLMQDKLLKSGQLKLNDYLVQRQNLTDGTSAAFGLIKEYQTEFKNKWDRMKGGNSQDLEQFLMAEAEGFGNFNETQLYINPTDGKVNVAYKEKGEDGVYKMNPNPNKFTEINALRNRIKGQFDRYDVDGYLDGFVKGLGKELTSIQVAKSTLGSTGLISETLDVTKKDNFLADPEKVRQMYEEAVQQGYKGSKEQWLKNQKDLKSIAISFEQAETKALKSQLANPYNTSSILTNALDICPENNKPYTYTWDENDAKQNPEKILLKNKSNGSPVPVFSEKQEEDALSYLRTNARLRYDRSEQIKTTPQIQLQERRSPTAVEYEMGKQSEDAKNFAQNLVYSLVGDASQQSAGTKYLGSKTGLPIEKTGTGYTITNKDGRQQVFTYRQAETNPLAFAKSMVGALNTQGLNEDNVMKYVKEFLPQGRSMAVPTETISAFEAEPIKLTPMQEYGASIPNITGKINEDEEKAFDELNASLSAIGASVRIPYTAGDYIVVKAPNGAESNEIDLSDPVKAKSAIDNFLKANPKGKTPIEQEKWIESLRGTGTLSGGVDYSTK